MAAVSTFTAVQAAKIVSIPAAGLLSGMITCMSFAAIPAISMAPAETAAKQWRKVYDIGASTMPPLVLGVAACFAFLAGKSGRAPGLFPTLAYDPTRPQVLYSIATALLPAIVPYTVLVMKPTNDSITARAISGDKASSQDAELPSLFRKWAQMNYVRALIVGLGATLAATATVLTS